MSGKKFNLRKAKRDVILKYLEERAKDLESDPSDALSKTIIDTMNSTEDTLQRSIPEGFNNAQEFKKDLFKFIEDLYRAKNVNTFLKSSSFKGELNDAKREELRNLLWNNIGDEGHQKYYNNTIARNLPLFDIFAPYIADNEQKDVKDMNEKYFKQRLEKYDKMVNDDQREIDRNNLNIAVSEGNIKKHKNIISKLESDIEELKKQYKEVENKEKVDDEEEDFGIAGKYFALNHIEGAIKRKENLIKKREQLISSTEQRAKRLKKDNDDIVKNQQNVLKNINDTKDFYKSDADKIRKIPLKQVEEEEEQHEEQQIVEHDPNQVQPTVEEPQEQERSSSPLDILIDQFKDNRINVIQFINSLAQLELPLSDSYSDVYNMIKTMLLNPSKTAKQLVKYYDYDDFKNISQSLDVLRQKLAPYYQPLEDRMVSVNLDRSLNDEARERKMININTADPFALTYIDNPTTLQYKAQEQDLDKLIKESGVKKLDNGLYDYNGMSLSRNDLRKVFQKQIVQKTFSQTRARFSEFQKRNRDVQKYLKRREEYERYHSVVPKIQNIGQRVNPLLFKRSIL